MDEGLLNDLLECSVCLERLDGNSKVLPCQHTFCKQCLEEIVSTRKELRCPECRILVEIKVDELPCNILLIRILDGMKNAPRMQINAASASQLQSSASVLSRALTSAVQAPVPHTTRSQPIVSDIRPEHTQSPPKQVPQAQQPCAKALYAYNSKEPSDLSFKKGDVITLLKKIDNNWFQGELGGKQGFFPASYVLIMTALPSHIPQCKALYHFKMNDKDEKDCLTFSKDEVITVIRRVDENWAEGKLSDRIGIFPIAFVEMNAAARALMKFSMNAQPGPARGVPPTPAADTTQIISTVTGGNACELAVLSSSSSISTPPSGLSSSSSPSTPSPSSPPSSTAAQISSRIPLIHPRRSSPQQQQHLQQKRHSFTHGQPTNHVTTTKPPHHRNSVDIPAQEGCAISSSSVLPMGAVVI